MASLFCLSSSCVPYVASISGLSMFDYPSGNVYQNKYSLILFIYLLFMFCLFVVIMK